MNKYLFTLVAFMFFMPTDLTGHSGRLDKSCGHKCSDSSKQKGLCSGYHYHFTNCPKSSSMTEVALISEDLEIQPKNDDSKLHKHLHAKTDNHPHN
ncbi:hypothetical protein N9T77_01425 [Pseudomonadota bacterium]|jgi:hypothetical protein|nr:hypothetical protein [Pseudomonadota bacterium]|tara:strand:- start:169 stop:456 length:288 start_codon:yes stop_codon:yes gene_type:complete